MPTQIASTPIVSGQAAKDILNQANQPRTKESKEGAKKLMKKFNKAIDNILETYVLAHWND